eukprot:4421146-Amphidinium_carterae.1
MSQHYGDASSQARGVQREEHYRKYKQSRGEFTPDMVLPLQDRAFAFLLPPLPGQSPTADLDRRRLKVRCWSTKTPTTRSDETSCKTTHASEEVQTSCIGKICLVSPCISLHPKAGHCSAAPRFGANECRVQ